jgi:hypothetical protein
MEKLEIRKSKFEKSASRVASVMVGKVEIHQDGASDRLILRISDFELRIFPLSPSVGNSQLFPQLGFLLFHLQLFALLRAHGGLAF